MKQNKLLIGIQTFSGHERPERKLCLCTEKSEELFL